MAEKRDFEYLLSISRTENSVIVFLNVSKLEFFLIEKAAKYWGKCDGSRAWVGPKTSSIRPPRPPFWVGAQTDIPVWKFHRIDGPAEIHAISGYKFYWIDGVWCETKEDYKKKLEKYISKQQACKDC